jgi:hypothetical protein
LEAEYIAIFTGEKANPRGAEMKLPSQVSISPNRKLEIHMDGNRVNQELEKFVGTDETPLKGLLLAVWPLKYSRDAGQKRSWATTRRNGRFIKG